MAITWTYHAFMRGVLQFGFGEDPSGEIFLDHERLPEGPCRMALRLIVSKCPTCEHEEVRRYDGHFDTVAEAVAFADGWFVWRGEVNEHGFSDDVEQFGYDDDGAAGDDA